MEEVKTLFGLLEVTFTNTLVIYWRLHPGHPTDRNRIRLDIINSLVEGTGRVEQSWFEDYSRSWDSPMGLECTCHSLWQGWLQMGSCITQIVSSVQSDWNLDSWTRHQVTTQCNTCQIQLCPVPCFQRYHTMKNFRLGCYKGLHFAEYQVNLWSASTSHFQNTTQSNSNCMKC